MAIFIGREAKVFIKLVLVFVSILRGRAKAFAKPVSTLSPLEARLVLLFPALSSF